MYSLLNSKREEESKEKCQLEQDEYESNFQNRHKQNQQGDKFQFESHLKNMLNLTLSMITNLEKQKIQFEILYARLKRILFRESEILEKELINQQAEFQKRKNSNYFENSLLQKLDEDRKCLRQDFDKLNEHLNIIGVQEKQIIETLDKINFRESQAVYKDSEREQLYSIQEYKYLQTDEFRLSHQVMVRGTIRQFAISKDWKYLAACQFRNAIVIWDIVENVKISQYEYEKQVYSIRISDDNSEVYFGDEFGLVSCLLLSNGINWQNQIHKKQVYYIQEKEKNQLITCSQDNRIVLTDISTTQIIWEINYICHCFSGFDISENNQLIVAPNGRAFSIWNINNGQEITKFEYIIEEDRLIQTIFSNNMKQLLVGLGEQKTLILFDILHPDIKIQFRKKIHFRESIKNISWCLSDNVILVNSEGCFQFRNVSDFTIIKEFPIYEPYFLLQKQDPRAKKIIFSYQFSVYIFERIQKEIDF